MIFFQSQGQEIVWKGKELVSGDHKHIDGEIIIRTPEDTVRATQARLYNKPQKKAVLFGNLTMRSKGTLVTGDSAIYFPKIKMVWVLGNAVITSQDGQIRSSAFYYNQVSKQLSSNTYTYGTAQGINFNANSTIIYSGNKNIKLIGNAVWENDSIKGLADTIFLDKANGIMKMSKKAKIIFKKKKDEIAGKYIEIDLNTNKITKILGSKIKRDDFTVKAKKINQLGEDEYDLKDDVEIKSIDSSITSTGQKALIKRGGLKMEGNTMTRLVDKEKKEIRIYAPVLVTTKKDSVENYFYYLKTNIRGEFAGFADSIFVKKQGESRETFMYRNAHLQNDSMFLEGDTLELYKDKNLEIIRAKRNAMMVMITPPNRVNYITAAFIQLTKTDSLSELYADGQSESYLWNDEKSNIGLNHTTSPSQKAKIKNKKISKVNTKGKTESNFQPLHKVNYDFMNQVASKLKESYKNDSLSEGLEAVPSFLQKLKKPVLKKPTKKVKAAKPEK